MVCHILSFYLYTEWVQKGNVHLWETRDSGVQHMGTLYVIVKTTQGEKTNMRFFFHLFFIFILKVSFQIYVNKLTVQKIHLQRQECVIIYNQVKKIPCNIFSIEYQQ